MRVFGGNEDATRDENGTTSFDLGSAGEAEFSCHFACHYADVEYCFERIKSGSRTLLRYSLHQPRRRGGDKPSASLLREPMSELARSLVRLPRADRILLIPTAKKYDAVSLASRGLE